MLILIAGVVIFFGVHLFSACRGCREAVVERIGEQRYTGFYVGGSVVGFVLVVAGVPFAEFVHVYEPPGWGRSVTVTLMPLAFIMLTALLLPTNIRRFTRHPMLWSFTIWSVAHLLSNGDLASILLFGSFGAYSVFSMWSLNRRGTQKPIETYSPAWDALAIGVGVVGYIFVVYLHTYLFGVAAILWI
jgi:uncharacterized membrane protein